MHTRTHTRKQAHTTHYFQRNPKPPHSSSSNNFAGGLSLLQKRHTSTQKRQSGNKKSQQENSIQTLSKNFAFHFTWDLKMILVCDERQERERRACLALEYLSVFCFFLSFLPWLKGLRTWRKELGLIICWWLSGRRAVESRHSHTLRNDWRDVKLISMRCCFCDISVGSPQQIATDCLLDWQR